MYLRTTVLTIIGGALLCTPPAMAQIQMDILTPASAYDAELLSPGDTGLDASLWQSTSAKRAAVMISNIKTPVSGPASALVRAALYSGGVPPRASDNISRDIYIAARLQALLKLGDLHAFDALSTQSGLNQGNPVFVKLFAERALQSGQIDNACVISDGQTNERKAPYWAKLRAYCHFVRGEVPAAELTADLLKRTGHKDANFFTLLGTMTGTRIKPPKFTNLKTPLHIAMAGQVLNTDKFKDQTLDPKILPPVINAWIALDENRPPETRLSALLKAAHLLTDQQLTQILGSFTLTPLASLDELSITKPWTPTLWGQAYTALKSGADRGRNAQLVSAMLGQADKAGRLDRFVTLLSSDISLIPAQVQAIESPHLFARIAINNRDLGALRNLYQALPEDAPLRARIALASDALGGGFLVSELGLDIEERLKQQGNEKSRAVRDTYIAVALGANLSDAAADILANTATLSGQAAQPGDLLALKTAARRGAKAEAALRVAQILGDKPLASLRADSLAAIIIAFNEAGMTDIAAGLAAQDFLGP